MKGSIANPGVRPDLRVKKYKISYGALKIRHVCQSIGGYYIIFFTQEYRLSRICDEFRSRHLNISRKLVTTTGELKRMQ